MRLLASAGSVCPDAGFRLHENRRPAYFELQEVPGNALTVTESGFDQIPLARRAEAFKANEGGWEMQTQLIAKYLAAQAQ